MLKSVLRSAWVQQGVGLLLAVYMRLARRTVRWTWIGRPEIEKIWDGRKGVILCIWHGRVLFTKVGWSKRGQPPAILVSRSPDGEFTAIASQLDGLRVIRGSTRNPKKKDKDKGGVGDYRAMIEHLVAGGCMCLSPDGPRGPRMRAGLGPLKLSRASGAPIMVMSWSTRSRILLGSWDRLALPVPFSKGVIVWKGPLAPPASNDPAVLEARRAELEALMNEAMREADALCGHDPIEPEPARPQNAAAGSPAPALEPTA